MISLFFQLFFCFSLVLFYPCLHYSLVIRFYIYAYIYSSIYKIPFYYIYLHPTNGISLIDSCILIFSLSLPFYLPQVDKTIGQNMIQTTMGNANLPLMKYCSSVFHVYSPLLNQYLVFLSFNKLNEKQHDHYMFIVQYIYPLLLYSVFCYTPFGFKELLSFCIRAHYILFNFLIVPFEIGLVMVSRSDTEVIVYSQVSSLIFYLYPQISPSPYYIKYN